MTWLKAWSLLSLVAGSLLLLHSFTNYSKKTDTTTASWRTRSTESNTK